MTLEIRPLLATDQDDWRRLWTAYLEFYESSVSEEVYKTTFERLVSESHPDQFAFLALLDGRAVGLVHAITHPHNWRVEDVIYLQDLYASPEARGQGVGRALIEKIYEVADQNGTPAVYWLTQEFNTTARQLYDRIAQVTPFVKYQR